MLDHQLFRIVRILASGACAVTLVLAPSVGLAAPHYVIATAGNTAEWNKKLGVDELWAGCSSEPAVCMKSLNTYARAGGVKRVTLSIASDPKLIADYALSYSQASLAEPRLHAIVLDDFVPTLSHWQQAGVTIGPLIQQVITNVKAKNPKLLFGLTLYEDQMNFAVLQDNVLPPAVRARVDRVSLFVHFRKNGLQYASYVPEAKRLFPNAQIMAGAYAYDRSDYIPCAQGSKEKCTRAQDLDLFVATLRIQVGMMDSGQVAGIQFYPNNFGTEQAWHGWDNPKACDPSQRQECVKTTIAMHDAVLQILH